MKNDELSMNERKFKNEYYIGIGVGLIATATSIAFGNKWPILMFLGLVFVLIGVMQGKRK